MNYVGDEEKETQEKEKHEEKQKNYNTPPPPRKKWKKWQNKIERKKGNAEGKIRSRGTNKKTNTTNKNTEQQNHNKKLKYLLHKKKSIVKNYTKGPVVKMWRGEKVEQLSLCTWGWMGKVVQWNEKYFGTILLPTLRWPISGPSVQKLRFRPRHFGATFTVISTKIGRFEKKKLFGKNAGAPKKHQNVLAGPKK